MAFPGNHPQFFDHGRLKWEYVDGTEGASIIDDFDGFLPEFWDRFNHSGLEVYRAALPFYWDYVLVIVREGDDPWQAAAALYAPGDVRPLGSGPAAVQGVNRLAPLRLVEDTAADYAWFLLWFARDGKWLPIEQAGEIPGPNEGAAAIVRALTARKEPAAQGSQFVISGAAWNEGFLKPFRMVIGENGEVVEGPALAGGEVQAQAGIAEPVRPPEFAHLIRVRSALGVERWLKPETGELLDVLKTIESSGRISGPLDVVRRAAGLDFYEPYRLYELLQRDFEGGFRRKYILCDTGGGKLKILNGTSPPIHEINSELSDARAGTLFEGEKRAERYLRFFCWAVHGEEGPFYLVRRFREISWREAPSDARAIARVFENPEYFKQPEVGPVDGYYPFRSLVAYSNALFDARFRFEWSGMPEMTEDAPLFSGLRVEGAKNAEGPQISLIDSIGLPESRHRQCRMRHLPSSPRLTWRNPNAKEARELSADFDAYLPEFLEYFDHTKLEIRLARLSFYHDYQLAMVRDGGTGCTILALYAAGDVRPLDGTADALENVNLIDPLRLTPESAADYLWFQLAFCRRAPDLCMPVEDPSEFPEPLPQRVVNQIRPLQIRSAPEGSGQESYVAEGVALERGSLRTFQASITTDGKIRFEGERDPLFPLTIERQANAVRAPGMPLVRVRPVSLAIAWDPVKDGAEKIRLDDALRENGVVGEEELIIHRARNLKCLEPFAVYRVLERNDDGSLRTDYVAFNPEHSDLKSIDGSEEQAAGLTRAIREKRPGSWLTEGEDAAAFLDFYLWSTHRRAVRRFHEIEWAAAPPENKRAEIESLLSRPALLSKEAADGVFQFVRVLNRGDACFRVVFDVSVHAAIVPHGPTYQSLRIEPSPAPTHWRRRPWLKPRSAGRKPLTSWGLKEQVRRDTENGDLPVVEIANRQIDGMVHLASVTSKPLIFREVWFEDELDLAAASSVEFHDCRFERGVKAAGANIERNLIFFRCTFGAEEPGGRTRHVNANFDGAEIGGNWKLEECLATGPVTARNIRVHGDASLGGLRIQGCTRPFSEKLFESLQGWNAGKIRWYIDRYQHRTGQSLQLPTAVDLTGACIDGQFQLGGVPYQPWPRMALIAGQVYARAIQVKGMSDLNCLIVLGGLDFLGGRFEGYVFADSNGRMVILDDLSLYGAQLSSSLGLGPAYIGKGLSLVFARMEGGLYARAETKAGALEKVARLHLGANESRNSLELSGAHCEGIELSGCLLEGAVIATTGQFGRIFIDFAGVLEEKEDPTGRNRSLPLLLPSADFIRFTSVTVRESVRLNPIRLESKRPGPRYYLRLEDSGTLIVRYCQIGGSLDIGADGSYLSACQALDPGTSDYYRLYEVPHSGEDNRYPAQVLGEIDLRGTSVKGDLNLTHVEVGERIRLSNMKVNGDVRLSRYPFNPWPVDQKNQPRFHTRCSALELEMLQCDGDLNLTGLEVSKPGEEELQKRRRHAWDGPPDIEARGLKVAGNILFSPIRGDSKEELPGASIGGALRMPASSASHLILSGRNFSSDTGAPRPDEARINLERSTFRRLEILDVEVLDALNTTIDLNNVTVDRWETAKNGHDIHPYLQVLKLTRPFKTGTYAQIERALRQQGDPGLADEVYRAMRARRTEEMKRPQLELAGQAGNPVRKFWKRLPGRTSLAMNRLEGRFLGYGTNPWYLFAAMIALAVFSWLCFSNQENVVAPADMSSAYGPGKDARVLNLHPRDVHQPWDWKNALFMVARYHVPIVGSVVNSRFEPSRRPIILPSWMYASWSKVPVFLSADIWASAMSYLNWALWSLLVLIGARKIRLRMAGGTG